VKLGPTTKVAFVSLRPNGKTSPQTKLLALVPKKGTTSHRAPAEKAEVEGQMPPHILRFVNRLARDAQVELS